jgi:poly-gamma-glutamate capsule biosynthesis protein CapA/YwtB (metallophosphatase superfamily)
MAPAGGSDDMNILLAGDVMTGRGIDQVLLCPCTPEIHEPVAKSASEYVRLAERTNGPILCPVNFEYPWGAAIAEFRLAAPVICVVNLETAITGCEDFLPKGINYRMSPANAQCLASAGIDCCVLANNHVLDWGEAGLIDTLDALEKFGIQKVGAGRDANEAQKPAVFDIDRDRQVVVFAVASGTSGTPETWAAGENSPGVNFLREFSDASAARIARQITRVKRPRDIVVVSIHWGPNWGYLIPQEQVRFAHRLIDEAGVSVVFGHSSHHAKAIELYRRRLILYGCGDFLNDYEGIIREEYRGDLVLLYALEFDVSTNELNKLELVPFRIRRFQLVQPSEEDVVWLDRRLNRENHAFDTFIKLQPSGRFLVERVMQNNE